MSSMIKTDGLTKIYSSGCKAIEDLSFEVYPGEIFGFLGPNGAGKSSTIKILTTLSRPTSGTAFVDGHDVMKQAGLVRETIGYVAQETGVDYFMSGRENLNLQGRLYRLSSHLIRERVGDLLQFFDLQDSADQLVSTYSGGMRRKLDIASALIHRPRLLFLDEPTLGLDPQSRLALWDLIRRLNQAFKVTVFLTTHYLDEADTLAQRIGIIDQGRIRVIGTPDSLKDEIKGDSVNLSFESLNGVQKQMVTALRTEPYVKDLLEEEKGVRVYVANGGEAIPLILKSLQSKNLEVKSVTMSRPSLDDVFLKYTGKRIEDSADSGDGNPWWAKWQKGGSWGGQKGKGKAEEESPKLEEWENDPKKWNVSETGGQKGWPSDASSWSSKEEGDHSKNQETKTYWKADEKNKE
ncbi:MAG TPA: ATP-binding cassette domain-containing protein [Nitrospiria bacterium]